jgi:P27 family predicted phage terminase small subunit
MARGRPPLPANVRRLRGETRPSRERIEPQPRDAEPEPPAWLSEAARGVWDWLVVELGAMGVLYGADAALLAALASSVATFGEAEHEIASNGRIYEDRNGQRRRSPWVLVRRDALSEMTRLAPMFGLSPTARAHLASPARSVDDEHHKIAERLLS